MKLFNYFINDSTSWFIDLLKTPLKETGVKKEKVEKSKSRHNWFNQNSLS